MWQICDKSEAANGQFSVLCGIETCYLLKARHKFAIGSPFLEVAGLRGQKHIQMGNI